MPRKYEDYHRLNDYGATEKQCIDCNEWFEMNLDFFNTNSNNSDGYSTRCKTCQKIKNQNYYETNGDKQREKARKRLENPETRESNRIYKRLWYRQNLKSSRDATNQYRKDHPNYTKFWNEKYKTLPQSKENFRRYRQARKVKTHKITKEQWELCKKYFNYKCAYCGLPIEEHYGKYRGVTKLYDFHKEHVINQGNNNLKNCVPSCGNCNSKKHTYSLNDWFNPNNPIYSECRYDLIYQWVRYGCKDVLKDTYKIK